MSDFYVMLGLARTATPGEIRRAYLERMKVLHPDMHAPCPEGAPSAADLNLAYWTLRHPDRRAAYDRTLAPRTPRPAPRPQVHPRATRHARQLTPSRGPTRKKPYYPPRSAYSGRARAFAALAFVLIASAAGAGTLAIWRKNERLSVASSVAAAEQAERRAVRRRAVDETLASAAAAEFEAILHGSGFSGASLYGRQCLDELAAQPNPAMVDYCLAFDRTAAEWEGALVTNSTDRRYFDVQARLRRYRALADDLREGPVRQAILAEAGYLAGS